MCSTGRDIKVLDGVYVYGTASSVARPRRAQDSGDYVALLHISVFSNISSNDRLTGIGLHRLSVYNVRYGQSLGSPPHEVSVPVPELDTALAIDVHGLAYAVWLLRQLPPFLETISIV
jgi:hypothetical protein